MGWHVAETFGLFAVLGIFLLAGTLSITVCDPRGIDCGEIGFGHMFFPAFVTGVLMAHVWD